MTADIVLEARALTGGYGAVEVLRGLNLSVRGGAITALVGGNGAGKTTTMRVLSGLLGETTGDVLYQGRSIADWGSAKRVNAGIALVPEGRLIFPDMSVEENLKLGAYAPRARKQWAESLTEVYTLFPRLSERRRQAGSTLSGGEQQMLALGRGLMSRPSILLLDEPSLGLAPQMVDLIFRSIISLSAAGMTILLSEQNVGRALEISQHAYVLENGHLVLEGAGADLLASEEVRRAYLGI